MTHDEISVLVVEDNPADMTLLVDLLPDDDTQSWLISHCSRLSHALEHLGKKTFDVVLLDLSLPDSQGLDTVVRLQAAVPHIPTVVLTGLQDKTMARQAVAQGAQDYLVKGQISPELLVKTVEYAIERAQILKKLQSQTRVLAVTNENLQRREREFRTLVENTPDIITRYDAQMRCLYANPASTVHFGLPIDACSGRFLFELGYPQEMAQFLATALDKVFSSQQMGVDEFCLGDQEGWRTYQTYLVPEFGINGSIESVLTIARDITQLRRTEAAFAEAESANRVKDEFLATLSHELRTPLNPILGWTRLLRSQPLSLEKSQAALETIERNAQRQAQLVEELLDLSQIVRGQLYLNLGPVWLHEPIQAAIATVRLAAEAKDITLEGQFPTHGVCVKGDAARLQQLFWNLLANAIKFTPKGGTVIVHLERVDQQAQIWVTDTGKGIGPEFLPFVFDRFRQEDNSNTRQFGGLGLGLALVRQLVEAHGGTVTAASPGLGLGATFTVLLPILSDSPTVSEHVANPLPPQNTDLSGTRVLLVEDEPDSRDLVVHMLKANGASVVAVPSADGALNALGQSRFDVLVSDIGLPFTNGYRLLQQVRQLSSGRDLPAIALTAYAGEQNRQTALEVGYQQHLSKPVEPEILIAEIAALVNLKPGA